jgi:hypothetical protein
LVAGLAAGPGSGWVMAGVLPGEGPPRRRGPPRAHAERPPRRGGREGDG